MAKWYYAESGERVGPVEQEVIEQRIRSGLLILVDRVFREGDETWRLVSECAEFAKISQVLIERDVPPPPADEEWVVLRTVTESGKAKYTQMGPYPTAEVLRRIHSGEIRFQDYVWKSGMADWVIIRDVPSFQRSELREPEMPPPPPPAKSQFYDNSAAEGSSLLSHVLVQKLEPAEEPKLSLDAVVPAEAEGDDLTENTVTHEWSEDAQASETNSAASLQEVSTLAEEGSRIHDFSVSTEASGASAGEEKLFSPADIEQIESARAEAREQRQQELELYDVEKEAEYRQLKTKNLKRRLAILVPGIIALGVGGYYLFSSSSSVPEERSTAESAGDVVREPGLAEANQNGEVSPLPEVAQPPPVQEVGGDLPAQPVQELTTPPTDVAKESAQTPSTPAAPVKARWSWLAWTDKVVVSKLQPGQSELRDGGLPTAGFWFSGENRSGDDAAIFRLVGRAGQILGVPSLHRVLRVEMTSGQPSFVALADLKIPPGSYEFVEESSPAAGLGKGLPEVKFATETPGFAQKLAVYNRQVKKARAKELQDLRSFLKHLQGREKALGEGSQIFTNPKRWDLFAKKWKLELLRVQPGPVKKINWRLADKYHFPDEWMVGREIRGGLLKLMDQHTRDLRQKKKPRLNLGRVQVALKSLKERIEDLKGKF